MQRYCASHPVPLLSSHIRLVCHWIPYSFTQVSLQPLTCLFFCCNLKVYAARMPIEGYTEASRSEGWIYHDVVGALPCHVCVSLRGMSHKYNREIYSTLTCCSGIPFLNTVMSRHMIPHRSHCVTTVTYRYLTSCRSCITRPLIPSCVPIIPILAITHCYNVKHHVTFLFCLSVRKHNGNNESDTHTKSSMMVLARPLFFDKWIIWQ